MSEIGAAPSGPVHGYHRLTVKAIRQETADARSFVLAPERGEAGLFGYLSGQFLTFRIADESGVFLRSYSLSSALCSDPDMRVCVKRVAGGRGSNWFNDKVREGERLEATRPAGRFVLPCGTADLMLIAGGSGITPCISLIKQALIETRRRVKLVYANQNASAVIYRDELNYLEERFPSRFECVHRFDDEQGFLEPGDIVSLVSGWEEANIHICGPAPLMDMAEETLAEHCGERAVIMTERFVSPDEPARTDSMPHGPPAADGCLIDDFRLSLDGEQRVIPISAGQTLLQAAIQAGIDAPHSCTEGHCGACMSRLREGEVCMASTKALSKRNIARGYVLACQSRPSSPQPLWLDFDL